MGGFKQLQNDLPADSLEQLEEDFSLAPATGTEENDTAARSSPVYTWLLINLTPKGVVFSFPFLFFAFLTQLLQVMAQTQLEGVQLQLPEGPATPLTMPWMLCTAVSKPSPSMHLSCDSICAASCAKHRVVLKPSRHATAQA